MVIRMIGLIVIILILGITMGWLLKLYVFNPRKDEQRAAQAANALSVKQAEVDYLEIRRAWLGFYNLNKNQEFYADLMDDMTIPEVAAFQRVMVNMNQTYGDLKKGQKTDETLVGKVLFLRTLFDSAVLEAKRQTLL